MGLGISHDCWHSSYSTFNTYRKVLAYIAGYPPLDLMEGFYEPYKNNCLCLFWHGISPYLPLKWDKYEEDPLTILLKHSDCEGRIENKDLSKLADRLEGLLDKLPATSHYGHIADWREKTESFIRGLRLADSRGEDIEFH